MVLDIVLSVLAALHMLAAGLASMTPLWVAGVRCTPRGRELDSVPLKHLAWLSVVLLVVTAVVGLAAGYLRSTLGGDAYGEMLERFSPRFYLLTAIEWSFTLLCYLGWYLSWKWGTRHPWWHLLIATAGATNLLYHFPPLMILQGLLVERPEVISAQTVTRSLSLQVIASGEVVVRTLHFYALAAGVTSALLLSLARSPLKEAEDRMRHAAAWGGLAATIGQIVTGIALVGLLPGSEALRLVGGATLPTLCLMGAIILSLALLLAYAHAALGPPDAVRWRRPLWLTLWATLLMTMADRIV